MVGVGDKDYYTDYNKMKTLPMEFPYFKALSFLKYLKNILINSLIHKMRMKVSF